MSGAIKSAANRIGIEVEEYHRRIDAGEKWCSICREWHDRGQFGFDRSRSDGRAVACITSLARRNKRNVPSMAVPCSRCGAEAGEGCTMPDGESYKHAYAHACRIKAYKETL